MLIGPAGTTLSRSRRVGKRIRDGGGGASRKRTVDRFRWGGIPGYVPPADPGPIVMSAVDDYVSDACGYDALIVPKRAALRLGARPVEHGNLVLVIQGFRSGEGERPVLRNDQRIAIVDLDYKASVGKRTVVGSDALKPNDVSADAEGHRRTGDGNAGDIRGGRAATRALCNLARLARIGGVRKNRYVVHRARGNQILKGEGLVAVRGADG